MDKVKIKQLVLEIEDKICKILNENDMCEATKGITCTKCFNTVIETMVEN